MTLTYPLGLLALLGIPAIIAIHFLQRQSRTLTVSTLFLLEQMRRESVKGRRFERIRNSIPLWLQLLMVLVLTWLLVAPQWTRPNSVQQIAVVLDSSASMSAFRGEATSALLSELTRLSEVTEQTEIVLLDSRLAEEPIFSGTEIPEMVPVLEEEWTPNGGEHDFGPALRVGRSLVGPEGLLILATDHPQQASPYNAVQLAVGEPKANVGFAGISTELDEAGDLRWTATVRNYGTEVQTRTWYLITDTQARSDDRSITLEPGEIRALKGLFPPSANSLTLHLSPDALTLDDTLPIIRPEPKPFFVGRVSSPKLDTTFQSVIDSFGENVAIPTSEQPTDLMLATFDPFATENQLPATSLVFLQQRTTPAKYLSGRIVSANHQLINDLNWQGLIARDSPEIPHDDVLDNTLLWQGDRALIILRTTEGRRQLIFNFDLATSNATNLPAFVVLLHRFVEQLRENKIAPESRNLEINEAINLALYTNPTDPDGNARDLTIQQTFIATETDSPISTVIPPAQSKIIRAPDLPGYLQIAQGETVLLKAATHFADTREADLSEAAEANDLPASSSHLVEKNATSQSPWQLILVGLLVLLLASWFYINRKLPKQVAATA